MEFVGDILKKTREGKKISLSNVSKELKISEENHSNIAVKSLHEAYNL